MRIFREHSGNIRGTFFRWWRLQLLMM
jgi:hypothetical protein